MSESLDAEERELRMALMRADLGNEQVDAAYNVGLWVGLWRHEPWKVFATVITASVIFFGTIGGVLGYLLGRIH